MLIVVQGDRPTGPTVIDVINGAERILTMVRQPEPPYDEIDDSLSYLYQAMSDIRSLVSVMSSDTDQISHPVNDLRALINKIHHRIRESRFTD